MEKAFEKLIAERYVTEEELMKLLEVSPERMRDLRSLHINGKQKFIDHIKISSKCVLYGIHDVENWMQEQKLYSFGTAKEDPDKQ